MADRDVLTIVENCIHDLKDGRVLYDPPVNEQTSGQFRSLDESSLCSSIKKYLGAHYPQGLFSHQNAAIEQILAGHNVISATRTSSGKSLIFSLPILHTLCEDPNSTALFLYPQKALANDQLLKLNEMAKNIPCVAEPLENSPHLISRYDGSTPSHLRPTIREQVQFLLTNPDMLHLSILQHHENHWARFFQNLKIVAIDECHEYRGIFGTNVSHILHRLRQICNWYGSDPKFIATSATVSGPREHMEQLTGTSFSLIGPDEDGSRQGRRKFWITENSEHYYDTGRNLALSLADQGLTVLAFCPSRVSAERMVSRLSRDEEQFPHVRVYRSGLCHEEREEIERGLRDRSVRLVFSTSALELGIDIGEIDVVVCIGLPQSMMSLWQRAGRSARGGRDGATIFIPSDSPIDTYYSKHPETLFAKEHESLALNRTNLRLLSQHYACAISEAGGDEDRLNLDVLGEEIRHVNELRSQGQFDREEFYRSDPHMEISIRGTGEGSYSLMVGDDSIGEIDSFHVLRESYRNAIYRHGGQAYRVKDVIRGKRIIRLRPERTWNETRPFIQKKIKLRQTLISLDYSGLRLAHVKISATEFLGQATEYNRAGNVVQSWRGSQGMMPHQLPTEGVMLLLKNDFWELLVGSMEGRQVAALESCERLLGSLFPTISGPCDTQDFSSATDTVISGELAIFLYDAVYDGVGLTAAAFHQYSDLVERSLERLVNCECSGDSGCVSCISHPHKDSPSSKHDTQLVLTAVLEMLRNERPSRQESEPDWIADSGNSANLHCEQCEEQISATDRFCANCGFKLKD